MESIDVVGERALQEHAYGWKEQSSVDPLLGHDLQPGVPVDILGVGVQGVEIAEHLPDVPASQVLGSEVVSEGTGSGDAIKGGLARTRQIRRRPEGASYHRAPPIVRPGVASPWGDIW